MKKIIILLITAAALMSGLTGCKEKYSEAEHFGARAAYTISRHLPSDAKSFMIVACDYYYDAETSSDTFRAECSLLFDGGSGISGEGSKYENHVYSLGTGDYFVNNYNSGLAVLDDDTGLYIMDGGNFSLAASIEPENKVDQKKVLELFQKFNKTKDYSILGMTK